MTEFIPPELKHIKELALYGITKAAVAVGVFDGVHRGHQKLLMELLTISSELNVYPVVMTFFPHPRSLLTENPPDLLYPPEEKLRLLYRYGIKAVITIPFTREFAALSPEMFLNQSIFAGTVPVLGICVGRHWRFGAGAAGNTDFLKRMAAEKKFRFSAVDELCTDSGEVISSTAIRQAISDGELEKAEQMLGRRYSLSGTIIHGYRNAGEKLNAPTANLQIRNGVFPPFGVYAATATLSDGRHFAAAVNIGVSPTFRKQYGQIEPRVEVHLLDGFQENLYGQGMKLELAGMVRREQRFPNADALKQQIGRDLEQVRKILERS